MKALRCVLFVCVLLVWCGCGCAAAGAERGPCKAEGTQECPPSEDPESPGPGGPKGSSGDAGSLEMRSPPRSCLNANGEENSTCEGETEREDRRTLPKVTCTPSDGRGEGANACQQSEKKIKGEENGQSTAVSSTVEGRLQEPVAVSLCSGSDDKSKSKEACKAKTPEVGKDGVRTAKADTGAHGPTGPAGPNGSKRSEVSGQNGNEGQAGQLENKSVVPCPTDLGRSTDCPAAAAAAALSQHQQQESGQPVKPVPGTLKAGGPDVSPTETEREAQSALSKKGDAPDPGDDGDAEGRCKNGEPKESGEKCKESKIQIINKPDKLKGEPQAKTPQAKTPQAKTPQAKTPQAPDINGGDDNPTGAKNNANGSVVSSPAGNTPEAESAAADHPNGESVESPAPATVEQGDAVQSQTSSTSTSTSATEATGSSQPSSSSPSTDKGQDPKAADSSS
ncbi:hypothetical protein DQ04_19531000, partial [Trypanosoma grayi]|uniref:hypothetical protein n=1 Tax=Trypanosoma grayi TaxID=71804 RepID=UPI0004F45E6B